MKYFFYLGLYCLLLNPIKACDVCGCFMGILPFENHHQISILHRYRVFNGYREYRHRSRYFPTGAYKAMHGNHGTNDTGEVVYSSNDFESFKIFELRGRIFLRKRLEINGILPFAHIKSKTDTVYTSHFGLSDPSLFGMYHIIRPKSEKKVHLRWMAGAGVKIPSGNYYAKDKYGNRFPLLLQPGTGSMDYFLLQTVLAEYQNLGIQLTTNYKINGKNYYNEKIANSFTLHHGLFYKFRIRRLQVLPSVSGYYESTKGLYQNSAYVEGTKMNEWMAGPALDVYFKKFGFHFQFQKTFYQEYEKGKIQSVGRWLIGLSYSFT
jgi:hypothetical protein